MHRAVRHGVGVRVGGVDHEFLLLPPGEGREQIDTAEPSGAGELDDAPVDWGERVVALQLMEKRIAQQDGSDPQPGFRRLCQVCPA